MKFLPHLIIVLLLAQTANAQQAYRTIYKFDMPHDVAKAREEWLKHDTAAVRRMNEGEHVSFGGGDSALQHNPHLARYRQELLKMAQSKIIVSGICTPEYYFSTSFDERSKDLASGMEVMSHGKSNGRSYFNRTTNTSYFINTISGSPDTTCRLIDTNLMKFIATGKEKTIGQWKCKEYKSIDSTYADISYWLTNELPGYIRPGIYSPVNVAGALVQVYYAGNNGAMTLVSVNAVDEHPQPWPCLRLSNDMLNPLDAFFRTW